MSWKGVDRVTAFASLNRQPVGPGAHRDRPQGPDPRVARTRPPEITATAIMAATADYFGLTVEDLCGSSRSRVLVTARQIAMYLCRELTDLSLPKIGAQFGGRDHYDRDARGPQDPRAAWPSGAPSTTRSPSSPTASRTADSSPGHGSAHALRRALRNDFRGAFFMSTCARGGRRTKRGVRFPAALRVFSTDVPGFFRSTPWGPRSCPDCVHRGSW